VLKIVLNQYVKRGFGRPMTTHDDFFGACPGLFDFKG
jgi:hypothetical protein